MIPKIIKKYHLENNFSKVEEWLYIYRSLFLILDFLYFVSLYYIYYKTGDENTKDILERLIIFFIMYSGTCNQFIIFFFSKFHILEYIKTGFIIKGGFMFINFLLIICHCYILSLKNNSSLLVWFSIYYFSFYMILVFI